MCDALRHFDGGRYTVWAFVAMPNHVHVLFSLHAPNRLEDTLHSWKGFTAKEINRRLARMGSLWQEDYWDRLIRNGEHFLRCLRYIRNNPAKAFLGADEYTLYERVAKGFVEAIGETPHDEES